MKNNYIFFSLVVANLKLLANKHELDHFSITIFKDYVSLWYEITQPPQILQNIDIQMSR